MESPQASAIKPRPNFLKAIGTLNVILGCFLFFCGLEGLDKYGPSLVRSQSFRLDAETAEVLFRQTQRERAEVLRRREDAAATDQERAKLHRERVAIESSPSRVKTQIDFQAIDHDFRWLNGYIWADVLTGPILNLLMLAAGIGLIQMRSWARTLGIWVAALKIARHLMLAFIFVAFVIPLMTRSMKSLIASDLGKVMLAKIHEDQSTVQGGTPPANPLDSDQLVPVLMVLAYLSGAGGLLFGSIYPAISLILLTRPGAKVAAELAEANDEGSGGDA